MYTPREKLALIKLLYLLGIKSAGSQLYMLRIMRKAGYSPRK